MAELPSNPNWRNWYISSAQELCGLFQGMPLDGVARALLDQAPDWTDESLLLTASAALESMGIELLDQRRFLGPWLAPAGHLAGPVVDAGLLADARRGLEAARALGRLSIGQTVVVKAGTVVAVEVQAELTVSCPSASGRLSLRRSR